MSKQILIYRRLEVQHANAMPAWWFLAPPSPTSFVGFGQALALKCIPKDQQKSFLGVSIVFHEHEFLAEKLKSNLSPHQFRAASFVDEQDYADGVSLSMQPTARCRMTVSVAVVFDEDAEIDDYAVEAFSHGARIAGGEIVNPQDPARGEKISDFREAVQSGFGVHLRSDLMAPLPGEDRLDALLRATRPDHDTRKENPWVMPALLGYAQITNFAIRGNSRESLPHAFVEPLIGLIQLKSVRQEPDLPVWSYQRPHERAFTVGY